MPLTRVRFGTSADVSYVIADPIAITSSPGANAALDNCSELYHDSCGQLDLKSKQCKCESDKS